jgi:transcriptional regulator with XRE-family HTH domain
MTTNRKAMDVIKELKLGPVTFGLLLRSCRSRAGVTQKVFAKKLGITVSHLSDIEKERKFVTVKRAYDFAIKLDDLPERFVHRALQDILRRAKLPYEVELKKKKVG